MSETQTTSCEPIQRDGFRVTPYRHPYTGELMWRVETHAGEDLGMFLRVPQGWEYGPWQFMAVECSPTLFGWNPKDLHDLADALDEVRLQGREVNHGEIQRHPTKDCQGFQQGAWHTPRARPLGVDAVGGDGGG